MRLKNEPSTKISADRKGATMYKRLFLCFALSMMVLIAGGYALSRTEPLAAREKGKQWFGKAKFGVFVHYLGQGDEWNSRVNSFDVERFA
ncbi:MAG: hypothetical protein ACFFEL_17295, partial [Candidatus Thorarchaeota archaeon]